jgi:hypothetical protein
MPNKPLLLLWVVFFCGMTTVRAQDLGTAGGQKAVTVHGSITAGLDAYHSNEAFPTRDPFAWNIGGSLTPSFYGFSLPFSFLITQYSKSYTSPFTQFGISPSYKWVRLHIGYRAISFSPLVFDGTSFLGGGIELSPKGFYFGAFYGRINKAISEDTTYGHVLEPQYARTGYGLKLGVGTPKNNASIMLFHAKDDSGSIRRVADSLTTVTPQENSVVGTSWHFTLFRKLTFTGDLAASLLNRDQSYQRIDSIGYYKIPHLVQQLMPINYSSVFSVAGQGQLVLVLEHYNLSAGYRRVQPDFKSLGVPYALDDLEMINASAGGSFVKGRLNLNLAVNNQHNDLEHMLSSRLRTRTGNFSANAFVDQHFNLNFNLTGVQVYQQDGLQKLTDTSRMDQLMLTATVTPTLNFAGDTYQHTVTGSFSYTKLTDHNPSTSKQAGGDNLSSSLNYTLFFVKAYWGVNASLLYSQYNQGGDTYQSTGLNGGLNAQLLPQHNLMVQGSVGYFFNSDNGSPTGNNTTFSFNSSYGLKNHSFSCYISYILTPPVNLNPLSGITQIPYAVNSKNLSGGVLYSFHF